MEINGVIKSYPPVNPTATRAAQGSRQTRPAAETEETDNTPVAPEKAAIAQAAAATQAAVTSVESGDASEGTRRAIVALAAAVGSPAAAEIVARAAKRFAPIPVHHAPKAPAKQQAQQHTSVDDVSRGKASAAPTLTQRTSSGELANSASGDNQARQARHATEKYMASITPAKSGHVAYA